MQILTTSSSYTYIIVLIHFCNTDIYSLSAFHRWYLTYFSIFSGAVVSWYLNNCLKTAMLCWHLDEMRAPPHKGMPRPPAFLLAEDHAFDQHTSIPSHHHHILIYTCAECLISPSSSSPPVLKRGSPGKLATKSRSPKCDPQRQLRLRNIIMLASIFVHVQHLVRLNIYQDHFWGIVWSPNSALKSAFISTFKSVFAQKSAQKSAI